MTLVVWLFVALSLVMATTAGRALAQCDDILSNGPNSNATSCSCASGGQTNCDLLPDIMINWYGLANTSAGPSEYSQSATSNAGRLRVSGVTPNVGFGPLEVRGVRADGYRKFYCGTEVDSVYSPSSNPNFVCPNGFNPKQILFQRIYHKNGNTMSFNEYERGTMTYHTSHSHYHVNGWTTMTLRLAQPGVSDPRLWPVLATGGKLGFCLTNLFTCGGSPNYCKDSPWYNQGSNIPTSLWGANYGLGPEPGCSDDVQSIVVGKGDIYDESLDGMWVNLLPGLCNGQYYIVAEADPANDFIESNETNNWTYVPVTLSQQSPANNGGTANILCSGSTVIGAGQTRTLTASPGTAYNWSTGATSRSITVAAVGTYSCTVSCPCGSLSTPSLTLTSLAAPAAPTASGATIQGPGQATLTASGAGAQLAWYDAPHGRNTGGYGNILHHAGDLQYHELLGGSAEPFRRTSPYRRPRREHHTRQLSVGEAMAVVRCDHAVPVTRVQSKCKWYGSTSFRPGGPLGEHDRREVHRTAQRPEYRGGGLGCTRWGPTQDHRL